MHARIRPAVALLLLATCLVAACGDDERADAPPPPALSVPADDGPAEPALRVAAPAGVLSPATIGPFTAASGCAIVPVATAPAAAASALLAEASDADVALVPGADVASLAARRRIALLRGDGAPSLGATAGRLRDAPGLSSGGAPAALPAVWAPDVLVAAPGAPAPTSLLAAFRPRATDGGLAAADAPATLAAAGLAVGVGDPFAAGREELEAAERLVELARPTTLATADAAAVARVFRAGGARVALVALPVAEETLRALPGATAALPADGTPGTVLAWVADAASGAPVCTARWLAWAASAEGQAAVARATGLLPARADACALLVEGACAPLGIPFDDVLAATRLARLPDGDTTEAAWNAAWARALGRDGG